MPPTATTSDAWLDAFGRLSTEHRDEPTWITDMRRQAMHRFVTHGMPTPRHEDWRYTNLAPLAARRFQRARAGETPDAATLRGHHLDAIPGARLVFVNGHYDDALSERAALPAGVSVTTIEQALAEDPESIRAALEGVQSAGLPFADLNTAFFEDGVVLSVAAGTEVREPIQLVFMMTSWQNDVVEHPRLLVRVGAQAGATLVERYEAQGPGHRFTNALTHVTLEAGARLHQVRIQREGQSAFHLGRTDVRQAADSTFDHVSISLGGVLARHEIDVRLQAAGAACRLGGLSALGGTEHVDNHTVVHHEAPHTTSDELYKGILGGKARGAFTGKMVVHKDAQQTSSTQANHNLLLSDNAVADTRPQLEIYADDVQCAHGATIGQLDEDQAFYLRSRGLTPLQARNLLIHGFAREVIEGIAHPDVRALVAAILESRLNVDVA